MRTLSVPCLALLGALCTPSTAQNPIYSFVGPEANSLYGSAIASAGDCDLDGLPDVIIGSRDTDANGLFNSGAAFVYSGRTGAQLDKFLGEEIGANFGVAVAGLGDVDGDGHSDVAVSAPRAANPQLGLPDAGSVRVFSGLTGSELYPVLGQQDVAAFGAALCAVGDWDGDGIGDFAVGASVHDAPGSPLSLSNAGRVSVHSGVDGQQIVEYFGDSANQQFGHSLAGGGDLDQDGFLDLAIGAPFAPVPGLIGPGRLQVYSGRDASLLLAIPGVHDLGHLGQSVDFVDDANADGYDDIVGGAYDAKDLAGVVTLYDGRTGAELQTHVGFAPLDHYGTAVAGLGDVNRDGHGDYAAGAFQQGSANPGYFQVHSGLDGAVLYHLVPGALGGDQLGAKLAGLGDVDGDGWLDLGATAMRSDPLGNDTGSAFVYDTLWQQTPGDFSSGPQLAFYGTPLASGGQADLELSAATPGGFAILVLSPSYAPFPLFGGFVAPSPAGAVLLSKVVNTQGKVLYPSIPGGGGPLTLHAQFVIFDGVSTPSGWAFSNHLIADFLP
jgi:hypothetical protein